MLTFRSFVFVTLGLFVSSSFAVKLVNHTQEGLLFKIESEHYACHYGYLKPHSESAWQANEHHVYAKQAWKNACTNPKKVSVTLRSGWVEVPLREDQKPVPGTGLNNDNCVIEVDHTAGRLGQLTVGHVSATC